MRKEIKVLMHNGILLFYVSTRIPTFSNDVLTAFRAGIKAISRQVNVSNFARTLRAYATVA